MEKAEVRSSISSQLKLHAVTQGDPEFTYSLDAGAMNLIPKGYRVTEHLGRVDVEETEAHSEPGSQVFQHAYNIDSEIDYWTGASGWSDTANHWATKKPSLIDRIKVWFKW